MDLQELHQSTEEFSVVLSDMASLQERIKLLVIVIDPHHVVGFCDDEIIPYRLHGSSIGLSPSRCSESSPP